MTRREKDGLLNELTEKLELSCISDLRFMRDYSSLFSVLQLIPIEKYCLEEWNDAAGYIGSREKRNNYRFDTPEEAYRHILNISRVCPEKKKHKN